MLTHIATCKVFSIHHACKVLSINCGCKILADQVCCTDCMCLQLQAIKRRLLAAYTYQQDCCCCYTTYYWDDYIVRMITAAAGPQGRLIQRGSSPRPAHACRNSCFLAAASPTITSACCESEEQKHSEHPSIVLLSWHGILDQLHCGLMGCQHGPHYHVVMRSMLNSTYLMHQVCAVLYFSQYMFSCVAMPGLCISASAITIKDWFCDVLPDCSVPSQQSTLICFSMLSCTRRKEQPSDKLFQETI